MAEQSTKRRGLWPIKRRMEIHQHRAASNSPIFSPQGSRASAESTPSADSDPTTISRPATGSGADAPMNISVDNLAPSVSPSSPMTSQLRPNSIVAASTNHLPANDIYESLLDPGLNLSNPGEPITMLDRLKHASRRGFSAFKIALKIAYESSDWNPILKSVLGGVQALLIHFDVSCFGHLYFSCRHSSALGRMLETPMTPSWNSRANSLRSRPFSMIIRKRVASRCNWRA